MNQHHLDNVGHSIFRRHNVSLVGNVVRSNLTVSSVSVYVNKTFTCAFMLHVQKFPELLPIM